MKNKTLSFLFGLFSIWFSALFYSDSEEAVEANFEMMKKKQEEKMQK